jgi:hypothetical protein
MEGHHAGRTVATAHQRACIVAEQRPRDPAEMRECRGNALAPIVTALIEKGFHEEPTRVAEHCDETTRFYRYASGLVQAALVPLALGMSADFYVVVAKISGSVIDGAIAATALWVGIVALWWGIPWIARRR